MSVIFTSLVQKKLAEWNHRVLSEDDAFAAVAGEPVRIHTDAPIRWRGEYLIYRETPTILIKKNLSSRWRLWVLWHELAHYWLHQPGHYKFHKTIVRKFDFEANFVAAIAMMPTYLVQRYSIDELIYEFNYPKEIKFVREFIASYYKI